MKIIEWINEKNIYNILNRIKRIEKEYNWIRWWNWWENIDIIKLKKKNYNIWKYEIKNDNYNI